MLVKALMVTNGTSMQVTWDCTAPRISCAPMATRAHRVRRFSQAQLCCRRSGRSGWLSLTAHPSVSAAEIEEYAARMRIGVHSSTGHEVEDRDPHIHDARPYDIKYPPCLIRGPGLNPRTAGRKPRLVQDTESLNRI